MIKTQQDINERYRQMSKTNDVNSTLAVSEAVNLYRENMDSLTRGGNPCMSHMRLYAFNKDAAEAAEVKFRNKRGDSQEADDKFILQIRKV